MELVIGDYRKSTWSMRPWLVLRHAGAEFTERVVKLDVATSPVELAAASPTSQVPALHVEGEVIWDSMAIAVWAAETYPETRMWPDGAHARWPRQADACRGQRRSSDRYCQLTVMTVVAPPFTRLAVSVLRPMVEPRTHDGTRAKPLASVVV